MKKNKKGFLFIHNISELDRLVLGELDAITNETLKGQSRHDRNREEDKYFETDIDDPYVSETTGKKRQLLHKERIWEEPFDTGQELDMDYPDESKEELLNEEEEKFVAAAVEWLRSRENKDVIVSKIWSLLTESEPESFYYPESEKIQSQAETSDSSEGNPKSEETCSKRIQEQSEPSESLDGKTKSETE